MKKIKNLLLVLVALFSMAFLAGCEKSAQIGTTLTFDKDIKGERTMHVELSKESFAENVAGSMEDIQAIFEESCPKELTYEFVETESSYTADIHLAFDSEEDYYDKVEAITDLEDPGRITVADSVFHSGIEVHENFESKNLLAWLSAALLEKQLVKSENESYIFDNSGCVVKYENEEYESGSYISVNQSVSTELRKIQVRTSLNLDGTWNREVAFFVPKASMDTNGDAIKEFLEEGVAKGAEGSWGDYKESSEKGQVYTIKAERIPVETMEKLMQKAFHTKDSKVSDETESTEGSANLVRSSAYVNEVYDMSEFVSGDYSNLYIEYIVVTGEKENSGTYSVYNGECSISQEFDTFLLPSEINLTSKIMGVGKYNRTFEFTFQNLQEEEKDFLKKQAENLAKDLGKVKTKDKKDAYTLTITVKGDKEKVGKLYQKIFGSEMNAEYAAEHKWMGFSNTFAYEEYISLSEFLPYGSGQAVDVNYELSFGSGAKISNKLENAFEKKGNTLYLSGSTKSPISVSVYGSKVNLRGIISIVVLILGILCLACFLFLFLKGKSKKAQPEVPAPPVTGATDVPPAVGGQNQPETAVPPVADPGTVQPETPAMPTAETAAREETPQSQEAELPEFCTNCGEKFESIEQMFCTSCGKKRGE